MNIKGLDLRLGDVVRLYDGAYADATVKNIQDGVVTLFRPYVSTPNFSYTGGVVCYVGIEEFKVNASQTFALVRQAEHIEWKCS